VVYEIYEEFFVVFEIYADIKNIKKAVKKPAINGTNIEDHDYTVLY
jgi:hypothetical protein